MRRYSLILTALFGSMLIFCATARAISVQATPAAAVVNETVEFRIQVAFTGGTPPICPIRIDFGDGSPQGNAGTCSSNCTLTVQHVYKKVGTYTVTVSSTSTCLDTMVPPIPGRTTVKIALPPATELKPQMLPDGIVGIAYQQQLKIPGGKGKLTYSLQDGLLPPGLALNQKGLLAGTPTRLGKYSFTVRTTDRDGFATDQLYYLTVRQATFKVTASPASFRIARHHAASLTVRYSFTSPDPVTTTLRSPRGEFFVNPKVGEISKPLVVHMVNGKAAASEQITIPASVSRRAEALHTASVRYRRTFTSSVMQPRSATVNIRFLREGAAQLRVTRIKIYFNNGRPKITVKRNQRDLRLSADVRYEGTGLLEGFFEVDGRIIHRVQKHVIYGRSTGFNTATFRTPTAKVLPTFAPGTHVARFVITRPARDIPFPRAVYFVTAENALRLASIPLKTPENDARPDYAPVTFTWERSDRYTTYRIDFAENTSVAKTAAPEPFFSALLKKGTYTLPRIALKTRFAPDRKYRWQVTGFDAEHHVTGKSPWRRFSFARPAAYVPGQILLVLPAADRARRQAEAIGSAFGLQLLQVYELKSLGQVVVLFHTDKPVPETIAALQKQPGVVSAQPNYIFHTLADPMRDMQSLQRLLKLDALHAHCTGSGVRVAVVDTGVDTTHRDLQGRVALNENFVADEPYRAEMHGTAVAGIIAAAVNGFGIEGLAPQAELLALRACRQLSADTPAGACNTLAIARAIDRALEAGAQIVNMSFGAAVADNLLVQLIRAGAQRGCYFVAPVGNRPTQQEIAFPASDPDVVAVAGIAADGRLLPNATVAAKADALAPAAHLLTTIPGNRHSFFSGTSIASAVVAGLLADAGEKNSPRPTRKLPAGDSDLCQWAQSLLGFDFCGK